MIIDLLLIIGAVLPALLLMFYIYKMDKVESEPIGMLARLVLFGCLITLPAALIETVLDTVFSYVFGYNMFYLLVENFIGVALVEEGLKWLMLLTTWKSKRFDYVFDGIVYAVFISLGFALLENILYVLLQADLSTAVTTLIMRAVTSIPTHMFCGVFMGYFWGKAKEASVYGNKTAKNGYWALSIVVPTLLHGFYDFCLSTGYTVTVLAAFAFVIAMYVIVFLQVRKASKSDRPMYPFSVVPQTMPGYVTPAGIAAGAAGTAGVAGAAGAGVPPMPGAPAGYTPSPQAQFAGANYMGVAGAFQPRSQQPMPAPVGYEMRAQAADAAAAPTPQPAPAAAAAAGAPVPPAAYGWPGGASPFRGEGNGVNVSR